MPGSGTETGGSPIDVDVRIFAATMYESENTNDRISADARENPQSSPPLTAPVVSMLRTNDSSKLLLSPYIEIVGVPPVPGA